MIKKVRRKFIFIAMTAIIICTTILVAVINLVNFYQVDQQNTTLLASIAENDGQFPGKATDLPDYPQDNQDTAPMQDMQQVPEQLLDHKKFSAEAAYETRFFTVKFRQDGQTDTNLRNIASVDEDTAISLAEEIRDGGKTIGYMDHFKYYVQTEEMSEGETVTLVVIMDCEAKLTAIETLAKTSAFIAGAGILVMFLIISLCSRRIIQPVIESTEKQKQFITDASHELKTPITVISTNMDILDMDLDHNEWVESTQKQVGILRNMVNQMVTLSRMEEESQPLIRENFDLLRATNEVAEPFAAMAEFQEKTFTLKLPEACQFRGDEAAYRQLLTILCDNAVKYTNDKGCICLSLRLSGKKCILEIENSCDTKVSPETIARLFDRFYRADASRTRENGKSSYGIGLAIAKAIVEKYNGKITARQDDALNMTFRVILPS